MEVPLIREHNIFSLTYEIMSPFIKPQKSEISETNFVETKGELDINLSGVFTHSFWWFGSP